MWRVVPAAPRQFFIVLSASPKRPHKNSAVVHLCAKDCAVFGKSTCDDVDFLSERNMCFVRYFWCTVLSCVGHGTDVPWRGMNMAT